VRGIGTPPVEHRLPNDPVSTKAGQLQHFAIAAAVTSPEIDFRHTVNMAKVGLLYADRVTLYSIDAALYRSVESEGEIHSIEQLDKNRNLWEKMVPDPSARRILANTVAQYKYIRKKTRPSPSEREFVRQMNDLLPSGAFREAANESLLKPGGPELKRVMDSGLVEVHEFRSKLTLSDFFDPARQNTAIDDMVVEFVESTIAAVGNGMIYPLLDDLSAMAVAENLSVAATLISDHNRWRGQHAALAGTLIERLPLFEEATVDEILDIRRALDPPLRQFRVGVAHFTDELKSASWDKDFHTEADRLFLCEIEPAILGLEEAIRQNNPLDKIAKRAVAAGAVAGSGLTLHTILSSLHTFPSPSPR